MAIVGLGVITDEVSQDWDAVLRFCQYFTRLSGLPVGAEVRSVTWGELECKNPYQITIDVAMMMKDAADEAGVPIIGVASPFLKCSWDDEAAIAEHVEGLQHCLDLAGIWEAGFVRVFNLWLPKGAEDHHHVIGQRGLYDDAFERALQIYEKMVKPLLPLYPDIRLGLENEATTLADTSLATQHFLDRLGMPQVRVVWDPANEVVSGSLPDPFPEGWNDVSPYVIHVHAKDGKGRGESYESTIFGEGGVIDWPGQLRALIQDTREFWVSLETHWRLSSWLDKATTDQPGGATFSTADAEDSSKICMGKLLEMLAEVNPA